VTATTAGTSGVITAYAVSSPYSALYTKIKVGGVWSDWMLVRRFSTGLGTGWANSLISYYETLHKYDSESTNPIRHNSLCNPDGSVGTIVSPFNYNVEHNEFRAFVPQEGGLYELECRFFYKSLDMNYYAKLITKLNGSSSEVISDAVTFGDWVSEGGKGGGYGCVVMRWIGEISTRLEFKLYLANMKNLNGNEAENAEVVGASFSFLVRKLF